MSSATPILHGELFELTIAVDSCRPCSAPLPQDDAKASKSLSLPAHGQRSVSFFVPESVCARKGVPLLIAFHGSTESGSIFRTRTTAFGYDHLACQYGFIVAYPSGYKGNWNDSRKAVSYPAKVENVDDVAFTKSIIQYCSKRWATSSERTLLAGYSNGGHMCYRLALELGSTHIAGVAVHCANLPTDENSDCCPVVRDAIPICILNGTADPVNPWSGGEVSLSHVPASGGSVGSRGSHRCALETADFFASRFLEMGHELEIEEIEDLDEIQDVRQFRDPTDGRVLVKLIAMIGEGHYVPVAAGEKKALVIGPRRGAVHAPREAINFFFENIDGLQASHLVEPRGSIETIFSELSLQSH